jgi:hypothetical protein
MQNRQMSDSLKLCQLFCELFQYLSKYSIIENYSSLKNSYLEKYK